MSIETDIVNHSIQQFESNYPPHPSLSSDFRTGISSNLQRCMYLKRKSNDSSGTYDKTDVDESTETNICLNLLGTLKSNTETVNVFHQ